MLQCPDLFAQRDSQPNQMTQFVFFFLPPFAFTATWQRRMDRMYGMKAQTGNKRFRTLVNALRTA